MKQVATRLNEASEVTIPLRNLISMIAFTAVSVWVYFGLTERLSFLEHEQEMMMVEIEENDDWIDDFQPPAEVKENIKRVRELELVITTLNIRVERLENGRQ
jgi:agmatine/peptidylarginine deiminase